MSKPKSHRSVVVAKKFKGAGCRVCVDGKCTKKIVACQKALTALKHAIKGGKVNVR